jgi:YegS/Rv2252/BmrU family lipid kinase
MRVKIIFNPAADHGRAIQLEEPILDWCRAYGPVDLVSTERNGHAFELAREAADQGYDMVISAGGDGTAHEIINGLFQDGHSAVKLGLIPIGSGNDFAYGLNLINVPKFAIKQIFTGEPRAIDLARLDDGSGRSELACNGIGIGFDATITIQSQMITRMHGFPMYLLATLRTIALYYQTPALQVLFDDLRVEQKALLLAIGLGPRIGGGFLLTPDALFDDALLDSCMVNPVGRATMLRMLPKVMRGTHVESRHVTMRRSHTISIVSDMPLPIHIDGEIFAYPDDDVRSFTVTSLPAALQIMNKPN